MSADTKNLQGGSERFPHGESRNLRANKPRLGKVYFGISRECDAPRATVASVTGVVISDVGPR